MSLFQGVWRTINSGLLESLQQILRQNRIMEFPHNPSLKRSPPLWLASQPCAFFWLVMLGRSCCWKGFVLWSVGGANRCCCFRVCLACPVIPSERLEFQTQVTHCIRQTASQHDFLFLCNIHLTVTVSHFNSCPKGATRSVGLSLMLCDHHAKLFFRFFFFFFRSCEAWS